MTLIPRVVRGLTRMSEDMSRMENTEDYDIFDYWEIGEMIYLINEAIKIIKYAEAIGKDEAC